MVGQVYGSGAVNGKAGVLLLIHISLLCEVLSVKGDD